MTLFDKDSYLTRVVLIPSAVFLSAIFGGAYGSDREVAEFMTRYGQRNSLLFVAFLLVFWLPLLTRGLSITFKAARNAPATLEAQA